MQTSQHDEISEPERRFLAQQRKKKKLVYVTRQPSDSNRSSESGISSKTNNQS